MKNPFFLLSAVLAIAFIGLVSSHLGQKAGGGPGSTSMSIPKAEANPIVALYNTLPPEAQKFYYEQSKKLTQAVPERLVELDQLTIGCFAPSRVLAMSPSEPNLGGQCCGILKDFESYELQLKTLHRFIAENGANDLIPRDPYDTPVDLAQTLTRLDSTITLSEQQQKVYNDAMKMSHHGGPCCCKCWKWYVMSGLAKKLIVDEGWNDHQIAELWDLSSSCGHDEDTDIAKHYDEVVETHDSHTVRE